MEAVQYSLPISAPLLRTMEDISHQIFLMIFVDGLLTIVAFFTSPQVANLFGCKALDFRPLEEGRGPRKPRNNSDKLFMKPEKEN